jgi:glutathione S-transferase
MRKWMRYFEEVPIPAVRVPSFNQYLSKRFDKLTQEQFDTFVDNHPIRKQFYKKMRKEQGFDDRETELALDRLRQTVARMESGLKASGGPWLMGDRLTLADYCIFPTLERMRDLGLDATWEDMLAVIAWLDSVRNRPAYRNTYYKGTRLSEIYDGKDFGAAKNPAPVVHD